MDFFCVSQVRILTEDFVLKFFKEENKSLNSVKYAFKEALLRILLIFYDEGFIS